LFSSQTQNEKKKEEDESFKVRVNLKEERRLHTVKESAGGCMAASQKGIL
jgi:hypothetical protein